MALQKTVTYKGIAVPDAYIKVWRFEGDKAALSISVGFAAEAGGPLFDVQNYTLPYALESGNPIAQAYEYLKSLPEFATAVDC